VPFYETPCSHKTDITFVQYIAQNVKVAALNLSYLYFSTIAAGDSIGLMTAQTVRNFTYARYDGLLLLRRHFVIIVIIFVVVILIPFFSCSFFCFAPETEQTRHCEQTIKQTETRTTFVKIK